MLGLTVSVKLTYHFLCQVLVTHHSQYEWKMHFVCYGDWLREGMQLKLGQ